MIQTKSRDVKTHREVQAVELEKRIVKAEFETHWTTQTGYYITNPRLYLEDGSVLRFESKGSASTPVKLICEGAK